MAATWSARSNGVLSPPTDLFKKGIAGSALLTIRPTTVCQNYRNRDGRAIGEIFDSSNLCICEYPHFIGSEGTYLCLYDRSVTTKAGDSKHCLATVCESDIVGLARPMRIQPRLHSEATHSSKLVYGWMNEESSYCSQRETFLKGTFRNYFDVPDFRSQTVAHTLAYVWAEKGHGFPITSQMGEG